MRIWRSLRVVTSLIANGWMSKEELRESCNDLLKTEYGQYLLKLAEEV